MAESKKIHDDLLQHSWTSEPSIKPWTVDNEFLRSPSIPKTTKKDEQVISLVVTPPIQTPMVVFVAADEKPPLVPSTGTTPGTEGAEEFDKKEEAKTAKVQGGTKKSTSCPDLVNLPNLGNIHKEKKYTGPITSESISEKESKALQKAVDDFVKKMEDDYQICECGKCAECRKEASCFRINCTIL